MGDIYASGNIIKFFANFFSYTFSTFSDVVHELEPIKWAYELLAVRIGSFWPKIEVIYRPEWTKGGAT